MSNKKREKITELTDKQESKLPFYRDKWLNIGLSTEPSDEKVAEQAINDAYKVAGLEPPKQIIWCDSPLSLVLVDSIISNIQNKPVKKSVKDSIREFGVDSVWKSVKDSIREFGVDSVWKSVKDSVKESVEESVVGSVVNSVWDSVSESVWDSVMYFVSDFISDSVWKSVWDSVWDSVSDFADNPLNNCIWGQHDAHWLGFYDFFKIELNIEECKKLEPLNEIAKHCNWLIPYQDVCLVARKPIICKLKDGKLHSDDSPAIAFKDGFEIYAIEGYNVPKELVLNHHEQTIDQISSEPNQEIKRIRISRYGWKNYLEAISAVIIDSQAITTKGGTFWLESLYYAKQDNIKALATYDPSTGRPYFLEVDNKVQTCKEAQAYLLSAKNVMQNISGIEIDQYPVLRT